MAKWNRMRLSRRPLVERSKKKLDTYCGTRFSLLGIMRSEKSGWIPYSVPSLDEF